MPRGHRRSRHAKQLREERNTDEALSTQLLHVKLIVVQEEQDKHKIPIRSSSEHHQQIIETSHFHFLTFKSCAHQFNIKASNRSVARNKMLRSR